jgi:glyoxalase-like protein
MLELDHVVIAAADLEAAAVVLKERYGLHSVVGGRHPDWAPRTTSSCLAALT